MRQIDGFKETAPRPPPPPPPRSMSFGASNIASPVGASTKQKGLTDTVLKATEETLSPKSHVVAAAGAVVEVEVYAGCAGGAGSTSAAAPPSPPDSLQVCRLCPDQGPVSRSHLQRCPSCRHTSTSGAFSRTSAKVADGRPDRAPALRWPSHLPHQALHLPHRCQRISCRRVQPQVLQVAGRPLKPKPQVHKVAGRPLKPKP